ELLEIALVPVHIAGHDQLAIVGKAQQRALAKRIGAVQFGRASENIGSGAGIVHSKSRPSKGSIWVPVPSRAVWGAGLPPAGGRDVPLPGSLSAAAICWPPDRSTADFCSFCRATSRPRTWRMSGGRSPGFCRQQ